MRVWVVVVEGSFVRVWLGDLGGEFFLFSVLGGFFEVED